MHLRHRVRRKTALTVGAKCRRDRSPIRIEFRFDAERKKKMLHLLQQRQRTRVERDVLRLLTVVRDRSIRREKSAQKRGNARTIQLVDRIGETFLRAPLIEDGVRGKRL